MQKNRRKTPAWPTAKLPSHYPQPLASIDKKESGMAVVLKEGLGAGVAAGYGQLVDSLEVIRCATNACRRRAGCGRDDFLQVNRAGKSLSARAT
jgi:hypothetical protein